MIYRFYIVTLLLIFILADSPKFSENKLEKSALKELSSEKKSPVLLNTDVALFSWWKYAKPEESELNARLIFDWNISQQKLLYYNQK